jgi:hypothetical protein
VGARTAEGLVPRARVERALRRSERRVLPIRRSRNGSRAPIRTEIAGVKGPRITFIRPWNGGRQTNRTPTFYRAHGFEPCCRPFGSAFPTGGGGEIRTHGPVTVSWIQSRRLKPLVPRLQTGGKGGIRTRNGFTRTRSPNVPLTIRAPSKNGGESRI